MSNLNSPVFAAPKELFFGFSSDPAKPRKFHLIIDLLLV